jgi:hypothetical protein
MSLSQRSIASVGFLGAGYVAVIAAVVWSMWAARDWALAELTTPQSQSDWQEWRKEVEQQQNSAGPVQRRVPKSAEPPGLVLMRDYFAVCLVGGVLFMSLLYVVIAWLVTGMMRTRPA